MDGQSTLTPEQVTEVERHKYFLSEKAGHDVGWDFAESDWRMHFGRVRIETTAQRAEPVCDVAVGESVSTSPSCESAAEVCVTAPASVRQAAVKEAEGTSPVIQRANAQDAESAARVGSWFKRLFSKDVS